MAHQTIVWLEKMYVHSQTQEMDFFKTKMNNKILFSFSVLLREVLCKGDEAH